MEPRRMAVGLATGALALAPAGCGGGETTASAGAERERKARDAALEFARCMRDNGVNVPDPRVDSEGGVRIAPGPGGSDRAEEISPDRMRKAQQACRRHLADLRPPRASSADRREMRERALAHARCMRRNGIDFPDPQFGEDGGMRLQIGPDSGIDPSSPAFRKAQEACRRLLPFRASPREVKP